MTAYDELMKKIKDIDIISQIGSLLSWDQEVMMPPKAALLRAEQLAYLSSIRHEKMTDEKIGTLLERLEKDNNLDEIQIGNIRLIRNSYDKATKLPNDFVIELAKHRSMSMITWTEAREKDDFSIFRDDLEKMISLVRREADYLGYDEVRYDALLDNYESGLTVSKLDPLFRSLRNNVSPLVKLVVEEGEEPNMDWVKENKWSKAGQENLSHRVSEAIGFDFSAGRRDSSTHPFCGGPNPDDVRWTTRYSETEPFGSLYGSMHETGHGMYEQGRPRNLDFQPAGKANGLGIHESQSRLWENQIGRSLAFCEWSLPLWKENFSENMNEVKAEDLWRSVNMVQPSLIRTESDEATYNLHIMIRYEIEKQLISGEIEVDDLPNVWNEMYDKFLGIKVPNDSLGVLQDVHWSMGAFGYFPTYTLGNLYSAQLLSAAKKDLGDINKQIRDGNFSPLLEWMRNKVHSRGSIIEPSELIKEATGRMPSSDDFVEYLKNKINELYQIKIDIK